MRGISRFVLDVCLVCGLVILSGLPEAAHAQTPDSLKRKIGGKWAMVNPPGEEGLFSTDVVVEFSTQDGTMKVTTTIKDKRRQQQNRGKDSTRKITDEAKFMIDEKQKHLEITFTKPNGDKVTNTEKIEVLDREKLVTVNQKGQKTEFKRPK